MLLGLLFVAIVVPLRVVVAALFRHAVLHETLKDATRVGFSLVPTLVFTLVLADILRERYALPSHLLGALVVFTLVNTALPGAFLRTPPPEFDTPEVPRTPEQLSLFPRASAVEPTVEASPPSRDSGTLLAPPE